MKTKPIDIWQEYCRLKEYLQSRNVYEIVKQNEDFYDGRQWEGVDAPDMIKPTINILQRIGKYQIATLSTNDVAVSMMPFSEVENDVETVKALASEIENVIEQAKIKESSRLMIRNAFVSGASYALQTFNPDFDNGQNIKGIIENEIIDNTNMYFGNPYSNIIQKQPFIIISFRQHINAVKEEARDNGISEDLIENIMPDNDTEQPNDDSSDLVTVLLKFFKKKHTIEEFDDVSLPDGTVIQQVTQKEVKTVHCIKCTHDTVIKEVTDLGYTRYPITCFGWDPIKNSYLYNSPMTSNINNQIFINKVFALAEMYAMNGAFPKIVYDRNKIDIDDFTSSTSIGAVNLDMMGSIFQYIKSPDFSSQILGLVDSVIAQTKECMGVNDASLGSVKPDNTSAIIALQEASNVPLEIQRQNYYVMWEEMVRNIIDIMANTYGTRTILYDGQLAEVNFDILNKLQYQLNVDIGAGSQYSEIAQMNTLDNIFSKLGFDADVYIESIPDKYLLNKSKILQNIKEKQQMLERQTQIQAQNQQV